MPNIVYFIGAIVALWVIGDGIVRIINASRGKPIQRRLGELESDLAEMDVELEETRHRLEVIERLVDKRNGSKRPGGNKTDDDEGQRA
ncbi:MAG: hypothetical protein AAF525_12740 [Pseudomonadota bacterium]